MRTLARELAKSAGKEATISGWLHKKRLLGGMTFLAVRDRSGLTQVVLHDEKEIEKLRGLQIGTVLSASGKVVKDERAPGGAELRDAKLEITVPVTETPPIEVDKPIDHKAENLDTLFETRVYNLRNLNEQKIFKIRASVNRYIREFLTQNEFVEIQTPKLLAEATEGGAEVFKLNYFDQTATLAQSPQLYKQMLVGAYERVFEIGPAFRAEPSLTSRHMSEVTMLDIEMGFIDGHEDVLKMTEDLVHNVLTRTYKENSQELKSLNAPELKLKPQFPRFSVAEVHEMYSKDTKEDSVGEPDLSPAEERWICEYAVKHHGCEAVFVTDFPVEAMKFYHQVNPKNSKTVLWADLLFRGLEIATVPMREHRYEKLLEQMKAAGLDVKHPGYQYYLQAFKAGLPPHGGFGFGIDRLVQKTVGVHNIKEATLFPRDINRLTP